MKGGERVKGGAERPVKGPGKTIATSQKSTFLPRGSGARFFMRGLYFLMTAIREKRDGRRGSVNADKCV